MRENCLQQFDAHWECLEKKNQVCISDFRLTSLFFGFYNGGESHIVHFPMSRPWPSSPLLELLNGVVNNLLIQLIQTFRNTFNAVNLNES